MFCFNKKRLLPGALLGMHLTASAVVGISDNFSTGTNTFASWTSVGRTTTVILYDEVSDGDYDDGDLTQKLPYSSGLFVTGDGIKDDGGLRMDSQNSVQGDEGIGLTVGGTITNGEVITFSGSVYNDNSSYSKYNAQLWNLSEGRLLAESGIAVVQPLAHIDYVPVDFNLVYTGTANDVGDTLQIRFVEDNNNIARDIYIDNFELQTSLEPPPVYAHPRLFFTTNDLPELISRRLTTHSDEWTQLIATCNAVNGKLPTTTPRTASDLLGYEDKIMALALVQLVDPDLGYQTTSTNWFWTILNWDEWGATNALGESNWAWPDYGPSGNLETGEILRALALWYDLQYHSLTPAQQADASQKLADYADRFRNSYDRFWTTENGELTGNHCWNAFGALAAVLRASDDVSPARKADWISLLNSHYNTISNLMTTVMSDGSTGEGMTYWTYGIEKILLWFEMRRVAGVPAFDSIDWFKNTGTYGIFGIMPGGADNYGGICRYDDADADFWGNPYNELSILAAAVRDPVAQWMSNELDHSGATKKNAYRYIFYDPTVPTADPDTDLNNWHFFDDYGFLFWRDSWANDAQHFTLRSGQHSHGHSKGDDGQFMLSRAGVPYIVNLGYAVPRYAQDCNVLLVNGTGQYSDGDDWGAVFNASWPANSNTWGQTRHVLASDSYYQKGDFFNVLVDPAPMYTNSDLSSWNREVVGLGGDLYLMRDTVSATASVDFDLLLHGLVTSASGDTYNANATNNPWASTGSGQWKLNPRSGSPALEVRDLSHDSWGSMIEETWYYNKNSVSTRMGNTLKRSLSGSSGTSLVSFGFDDRISGWTQSGWTNSTAEGVHVTAAGIPVIDVLWPLNGTSVSASDGWSVTGKMAGRRYRSAPGNAYLEWMQEYDGTSSGTLALYKFSEAGLYTNGANAYSAVLPDRTDSEWDAYYPYATATCSFNADGKYGRGLSCPGGSSLSARCLTQNGSSLFPAGADPSLTVECWVKFNDTSSLQFLVSKGNGWSSIGGYDLWYDSGSLKFAVGNGSAKMTTGSWTPVAGTWYHLAGTWDAATDTAAVYVNGVGIASQVFAGLSIVDHAGRALVLGNRSVSTYYALNGIIDEVRISDAAYAFAEPSDDTEVCYFGREATSVIDTGQTLLSASTPVSFYAKTEQLPGGTVPNRVKICADAPATVTLYSPYEPKSVQLDGSDIDFSWSSSLLTFSVPAADQSTIDLVDASYLTWRDGYFSEAEINSGLAGLDADPDGDGRTNWEECNADTDPRNSALYWNLSASNGIFSYSTSTARIYTVEYRTNLLHGSWNVLSQDMPGAGSDTVIQDTNSWDNVFYRVKVAVP